MKGLYLKIILGLGFFWLGSFRVSANDFLSESLSDNPNITLIQNNQATFNDFFLSSIPSHSDKGNKNDAEEENQQEEQEQEEEDETEKNEKNEKRKKSCFLASDEFSFLPACKCLIFSVLTPIFNLPTTNKPTNPIYICLHNFRN
jgi:hypothetical protein